MNHFRANQSVSLWWVLARKMRDTIFNTLHQSHITHSHTGDRFNFANATQKCKQNVCWRCSEKRDVQDFDCWNNNDNDCGERRLKYDIPRQMCATDKMTRKTTAASEQNCADKKSPKCERSFYLHSIDERTSVEWFFSSLLFTAAQDSAARKRWTRNDCCFCANILPRKLAVLMGKQANNQPH